MPFLAIPFGIPALAQRMGLDENTLRGYMRLIDNKRLLKMKDSGRWDFGDKEGMLYALSVVRKHLIAMPPPRMPGPARPQERYKMEMSARAAAFKAFDKVDPHAKGKRTPSKVVTDSHLAAVKATKGAAGRDALAEARRAAKAKRDARELAEKAKANAKAAADKPKPVKKVAKKIPAKKVAAVKAKPVPKAPVLKTTKAIFLARMAAGRAAKAAAAKKPAKRRRVEPDDAPVSDD